MYLFQQIEEVMMHYNDARQVIGKFVLNEKDRLHKYSMEEIAQYTYTSKATLVRFAKTLGYKGWRDFMKAFIEEARYQDRNSTEIDVNYPFNENDNYKEIIKKISRLQIESIMDTADKLDEEMIKKAVIRILGSERMVIFGMKPNTDIAESLKWKFLSIGKFIYIAEIGEMGMITRSLREKDCAIIISYSGNNSDKDPMKRIAMLKNQKVNLIGITSGGKNYIRENIDCVLTISSRERLYSKIANFATEQSILCIFNILFACCFKKEYKDNLVYKIENSKNLEKSRRASLNVIEENI